MRYERWDPSLKIQQGQMKEIFENVDEIFKAFSAPLVEVQPVEGLTM